MDALNGAHLSEPDCGNPLTAELEESPFAEDDGPPNIYREAAEKANDFYKNCARAIKEFKGDRAFAFDVWLLTMGWYQILGVRDQVELAAKWGCDKANVSKLVKKFQAILGLPPMPGQRSLEGCNRMRAVRKSQLNGHCHPMQP